jgi:uncharacterized coiled-coil protein SlyX
MLEACGMAVVEQRVAYLEGQVTEQSQALTAIRDSLGRFEKRVDARFNAIDARFNALEAKMSTQFLWIIGIQFTMLAVLAALTRR